MIQVHPNELIVSNCEYIHQHPYYCAIRCYIYIYIQREREKLQLIHTHPDLWFTCQTISISFWVMNCSSITVRSYVCWREAVPAVGGEGAEISRAPLKCSSKRWDHSQINGKQHAMFHSILDTMRNICEISMARRWYCGHPCRSIVHIVRHRLLSRKTRKALRQEVCLGHCDGKLEWSLGYFGWLSPNSRTFQDKEIL